MFPHEGALNKKLTPRQSLVLEHMGSLESLGRGSQWRDLGQKAKFSYTRCGKGNRRPEGGEKEALWVST